MPKAHVVFSELARLLGEQDYFAGDTVSLADLLVAPAVDFFTATPEWSVLGAPHAKSRGMAGADGSPAQHEATTWERVSEMAKAA